MLLQESNSRIESYIIELQKGNEELAAQVEALLLQYSPDDLVYFKEGVQNISYETILKKVRYIAHGTTMAINKSTELAGIEKFITVAQAIAPDILANPESRQILLTSYVDNLGGTLERQKTNLLPQPPSQEEQVMAAFDQLSPEEQAALQ